MLINYRAPLASATRVAYSSCPHSALEWEKLPKILEFEHLFTFHTVKPLKAFCGTIFKSVYFSHL